MDHKPWEALLRETLALVERSTRDGWPDESPEECAATLRAMLRHLADPAEAPRPEFASIQFAPTGPIQEIAMTNGWHDAYLDLADRWDALKHRDPTLWRT